MMQPLASQLLRHFTYERYSTLISGNSSVLSPLTRTLTTVTCKLPIIGLHVGLSDASLCDMDSVPVSGLFAIPDRDLDVRRVDDDDDGCIRFFF